MAFGLLLSRNISRQNPNFHSRIPFLITNSFWLSDGSKIKPFSTSQSSTFHTERDLPKVSDPKTSLSARMSFVFDQIDAIEKDRSNKDDALQRIRAWRETKKKKNEDETSRVGFADSSVEPTSSSDTVLEVKKKENLFKKEVEVVHPWPEWVELMERLVQQNYFDHRRRDEDKIVEDLSIDISSFPEAGFDFSRDWTAVRTACLNFGRERFDILRSLSRHDLQILVGHGCPSTDKKVVFSGKMLRKHVHLDEGDVCSSCNLRGTCEKAYLLGRKEDEARTIDVMRVLLTYGFDPVSGSVENKSLLKLKTVKTVVRKLLHEVVKLSAVPIDPNLPPPIFKKPPAKVKQPPPPPRRRVGRDDIEMKKGDWLCTKCDFMNFAKNTVCLQCDAKRPKRQLLPGEWECPECNFLNYRRNMACFHCDHKRPPDEFMENQTQARQDGSRTRLGRVTDMPAGSNSWNFDFDDNESDGADVAAFEYADPPRIVEDSPVDNHTHGASSRGFEDDSFETPRISRSNRYSDLDQRKSGTGFDDFDDEEDDDINSYEVESPSNNSVHEASRDFSEVVRHSESDDFDDFDRTNSSSYNKPSRRVGRKAFSGSEDDFDSDGEPPANSKWKSSHVGDSRNGIRDRGRSGPYRGTGSRRGGYSGGPMFNSESDDDDLHSGRNKFGGSRGGNSFRSRDEGFRSNDRRNDDHGRPFRGSHRNNTSNEDGYNGRRSDMGRSSRGSFRNERETNRGGFGGRGSNDRRGRNSDRDNKQGGGRGFRKNERFSGFNDGSDVARDFGVDDRPRKRIIER